MPRGTSRLDVLTAPGGVREDLNPKDLPSGVLLSSSNWLVRDGRGRPRPGYDQLGSALAAADRLLGFGFRGDPTTTTVAVAHTRTAAYSWNGSAWSAITGTWTASAVDEHVRFAAFQSGTTLWLARTNAANPVDKWSGSGNFQDVAAAPAGRDLLVSGNRLIVLNVTSAGVDYPYRVWWSDINDIDTWGASDFATLNETPDVIVGGKSFGPLSFAIYKENSVWLGVQQAALQPFQFQLVAITPGPLSPAAIVAVRGYHYWLARDGLIYRFDGSTVTPSSAGARSTFQVNFDFNRAAETHGALLSLPNAECWFWYPVLSPSSTNRAISFDTVSGALHHHTMANSITASSEWILQSELTWDTLVGTTDGLSATYASWDAMGSAMRPTAIVGGTTGAVYQFGGTYTSDNGTAIAWEFQLPWLPLASGQDAYFDAVRSYWVAEANSLTVTLGVVVTDSLGDADTETTTTFNLTTDSDHLATFPNQRGKWARVRHAAASVSSAAMEHRSVVVTAWPRGRI